MTKVLKMNNSLRTYMVGDVIDNGVRIMQVVFKSKKHLVLRSMDMQLFNK